MFENYMTSCKIEEGDLLAYLDGLASLDVGLHIRKCVACQEEVTALRAINTTFKQVLSRINCPDSQALLLYETKLLAKRERHQIGKHVADCAFCEKEVAQLAKIPFKKPLSTFERMIKAGKQIIGAFRLPAASQPAFARLGDEDEPMVYQAGDYQIMLATSSPLLATNIRQIEGQIINLEDQLIPSTGSVSLLHQTQQVANDNIDEFGYFVLEDLRPGEYSLHIDLPTTMIPIDKFVIP